MLGREGWRPASAALRVTWGRQQAPPQVAVPLLSAEGLATIVTHGGSAQPAAFQHPTAVPK